MGNQEIILIESEKDLTLVVSDLSQKSEIAVDLEFDNNRYRYGFTLCLIQVATRSHCYIIDPFKCKNLDGLFDVFRNQQITKIMHCPGEDLRLLHSMGCYPQQVLDTDFCGRLLNYENPSLANLLGQLFNITLDKRHQTSNWHNRPLSREQVEYAAMDVLWLFELKDFLWNRIEHTRLFEVLLDEIQYLNEVRYQPGDKENLLTKADRAALTDHDQFVLNELLKFRDKMASVFNLPPAHVISNSLMRMIVSGEIDLNDWVNQKDMYSAIKNEKFQRMIQKEYQQALRQAKEKNILKIKSRAKREEDEMGESMLFNKAEILALKEKYLRPVQQELMRMFGEHTGKFLLGEGVSNDIIRGKNRIRDLKGSKRQELILETAESLGIDLGAYC
jgi:ribonuclease D